MSYTSWQQLACNIHNYANFSQVMWTVILRFGTPATFLTKSQTRGSNHKQQGSNIVDGQSLENSWFISIPAGWAICGN